MLDAMKSLDFLMQMCNQVSAPLAIHVQSQKAYAEVKNALLLSNPSVVNNVTNVVAKGAGSSLKKEAPKAEAKV